MIYDGKIDICLEFFVIEVLVYFYLYFIEKMFIFFVGYKNFLIKFLYIRRWCRNILLIEK